VGAERIVRMLEEVRAELAESKCREEQIAGDLERLLQREQRATKQVAKRRLMGWLGGRVGGGTTPGPRKAEARERSYDGRQTGAASGERGALPRD